MDHHGAALEQPYVWKFYARETYPKDNNARKHTVGVATCHEAGCRGEMTLTIPTSRLKSLKRWERTAYPAVCLVRDQLLFPYFRDHNCNWKPEVYGGCPFGHCLHYTTGMGKELKIPILGPDSKDWEAGVRGKIYVNMWHSGPVGDIFIYKAQETQNPSLDTIYHIHSVIEKEEKTLSEKLDNQDPVGPFSWIKLIQQGTQLLNLTSPGNYNNCFLCAYLNRPPLTAVPLR